MGLDMYVYRAYKPGIDPNKIYNYEYLDGFRCLENEIDQSVEQILPYCQKIKTSYTEIDKDKLFGEYGFSELAYFCRSSYDKIYVLDPKRDGDNTVMIPMEEVTSGYTKTIEAFCYYCHLELIHYWRNAYDVQEWFHKNLDLMIENCGFYSIDEDTISAYNEAFPESKIFSESGSLFYHEWY